LALFGAISQTHFVYIDSTFGFGMPLKAIPVAKLLQSLIGTRLH
jgi:hypothetical protein